MNDSEFYVSVDKNFKNLLDHPAPELLLRENKQLFSKLLLMEGSFNKKKDYEDFEIAELIILNYLLSKNNKPLLTFNKDPKIKFDHKMEYNGKIITYEVKVDCLCRKTGNVPFEIQCRGRASGMYGTDADFVAYVIPLKNISLIGFVKLEKILSVLDENKTSNKYEIHKTGGDPGSNTHNVLIPLNEAKKIFDKVIEVKLL